MEREQLNVNELIKVEALPKIFYQLEEIGKFVSEKIGDVANMECTEQNKSEVKKRKQEITAFKKLMEDRRKDIKKEVLQKYDIFEEKYNQEIKKQLEEAEEILTNKYKVIENQQKEEKTEAVKEFANKHIIANNLQDFLTFEQIGLNVTLSASEKSLKAQAKDFIDEVLSNINLIESLEFRDEIMVEYKKNLDVKAAITEVNKRKQELKKLEEAKHQMEEKEQLEEKIVSNVNKALDEEIIAPQEIEEKIEITFTVKATKDKLKELKQFIINNGIEYK